MGMVTFMVCDRCHDLIQDSKFYHLIAPWQEYYLCYNCSDGLKEWIRNVFAVNVPD